MMLVERKLVASRSLAQRLIMAGSVRVNGQLIIKSSHTVTENDQIDLKERQKYVSRGGEKLEAALIHFEMNDLSGAVCADVGASTGGFTDCLLQHGAIKVYAIDVGNGELNWKLRNDSRVIVMEKTNARYLSKLPETIDLVTIDASFISLKTLLTVVKNWLKQDGKVIALIKPQFEAGRKEAARGAGVIRSSDIHRKILVDVLSFAKSIGFQAVNLIRSPLLGPKGNVEFLVLLKTRNVNGREIEIKRLVDSVIPVAENTEGGAALSR